MSSIGWHGPKLGLPQGTYQFRRLGLRDLRELYSIWVQYQNDTAKRLRLTVADLDDLSPDRKEEIGESLYELALDAPERAFGLIFSTLVPVANSGPEKSTPEPLCADDVDDEEKVPIWFLTSYIDKLLEHKDFDRFFTELVGLLRKDGKLRKKIAALRPKRDADEKTEKPSGSGKSSDRQDGPTSTS